MNITSHYKAMLKKQMSRMINNKPILKCYY